MTLSQRAVHVLPRPLVLRSVLLVAVAVAVAVRVTQSSLDARPKGLPRKCRLQDEPAR